MTEHSPDTPLRILLVDDDPLIRSVGRELLENLGYEVATAGDGEEALSHYGQGAPPDLVILDYHLPGLSGPELVRRLRRLHPEAPVLVASGFFAARELADLEEAGALGFLNKPFRLAELKSRIEDSLGNYPRTSPTQ